MSLRIPFLALVLAFMVASVGISTKVAQAGNFKVENDGDHTIVGIWVTPDSDDYWGPELLGNDVLDPGYYAEEYVSGCYADIRVLYDDNQVSTDWDFDTCTYNLISYY